MGVRTLTSVTEGKTVIYDSVTDIAFGPVFYEWDPADGNTKAARDDRYEGADSEDVAVLFLDWLEADARKYTPNALLEEWVKFTDRLREVGFTKFREEVDDADHIDIVGVREEER